MAINDKLLFKQALSAEMFSPSTGEMLWTLEDLKGVNISFSADSEEKTDATNAVIAKYYQAKTAQVTGNTSFFTTSLIAAQFGSSRVDATSVDKITAPVREKIKIGYSSGTTVNTTVTLSQIPVGTSGSEIPFIYIVDKSGVIVGKYSVGTEASSTKFVIDAANKTITLPTDATTIKADNYVLVFYSYETATGCKIDNNAKNLPKSGTLWIECLFTDICDKNIEYHGWIVMNSAQLSPETEIPLDKTGDFPFTIDSTVDYCSEAGQILSVVIPEVVAEA